MYKYTVMYTIIMNTTLKEAIKSHIKDETGIVSLTKTVNIIKKELSIDRYDVLDIIHNAHTKKEVSVCGNQINIEVEN